MRRGEIKIIRDAGSKAEAMITMQINMNLTWYSSLRESRSEAVGIDRRNAVILARVPDEGRRGLVVDLLVGREEVEERAVAHAVLTEEVDERAHMREL